MDVVAVIVTIGGYFVDPIKKHCGYLFHCHSNTEDLKDRIQKLLDETKKTETEIDIERRNGRVITRQAEAWMEKVGKILGEDDEANNMSLNGWRPRYSLSRRAKKKTLKIDGLLEERQSLIISLPLPPLGMKPLPVKDIMNLGSRTNKMDEVLEALRDDKVNMIAICGMGGIGKTSMAKVVANRAKFDEVAFAVVSQDKGESKIQDEIARMLGLELDEKDPLLQRAERLKSRLMDSKKSKLVILDDVWDALDLEAVGIPYGGQHNGCKILLTSRSEEACTQMKTQKIIPIKVLPEEEAWNLFRGMAGNCIDTPKMHPIAKEVTKECGGLPVAIVTVGRALENKSEFEWSAALQQLQNAIPENITGLDSKVYSSIKLSYSYLKSDEAKSCFLLCCLFPEDHDILIEYLVRYGVGQRLFAKIDTVAEARNRVHAMVKNLKRSFLLLDSEKGEQFVKMHDVVRDVAISIAENQGFLVRCKEKMEEWPEKDSCERCTAISLVSAKLKRHPDGLECPKLELLQLASEMNNWYGHPLQHTLPPNLFKGMEGLKVLTLFCMSFETLPQSINVLQNLRTLQFVNCVITDASAIGELRKLEILSFTKSQIWELPGEMRNLSYLKLLDLSDCYNLERIPPDLLSNLSHLQELYMLGVDVKWKPMEEEEVDEKEEEVYEEEEEVDEEEKKGANASLAELKSLSELVALEINIPNIKVLPKDLTFENKKIEFQIFVGGGDIRDYSFYRPDYLFKNWLGLGSCDVRDIVESSTLLQLLKKSEILKLNKIKDLKNIVYQLDNEGFQCLKVLEVFEIDDVEYVLDATSEQNPRAAFPTLESLQLRRLPNLKEIYHSQSFSVIHSQPVCFGKLRSIFLSHCNCLKNVFSLSIARGLVQLQKLDIQWCKDMEECFPKEGEDEEELDKITFRHLTSIEMCVLDGLIGFCTGVGPVELVQPSLNREVGRIGTDEVTNLEKHKMTNIQQHTGPFPESTPIISHKLFSSNTILWAPNLENLILKHARSLEVVFDLEGLKANEDHQRIAVLAQLKTLEVENLSELRYVWKNVPQGIQGFQKLTSIEVSECHRLRYLFPTSIAKLLVELQSIVIYKCDAIENIVQRDGEEEATDIKAYSFEWSSVKKIYLGCCPKLKTIGSKIQSPRKSKKINRELDSRPNEQELGSPGFVWRCLECVPRRKNDGLMVVSDQGTTNKSQRSYSVKEESTLGKPNDPKVGHKLFSSNTILWAPNLENLALEEADLHLENLELEEADSLLENLELEEADSLEVVFDLEGLKANEDHQRIAVLAQLKTLEVDNLSLLRYVWKNVPQGIQGFQKLTSIEVSKCHRLRYLFPTSIARLLVELQNITIVHCYAIENVVQRDGEEEVTDIKAYSFEWSSVKKIYLRDCPKLKTIGSKIQSPRKSKKINRELDSRPNEQELGSPGFVWRCLECVPRRKNDGLMVVSDQGTTNKSQRSYSVKEESTLGKPNDPKVGHKLFSSNTILWAPNLENLELVDSDSPEVVFDLEGLKANEDHQRIAVLDQLRGLNLCCLPKLMHIWKKVPKRILGFGNLRLLRLWGCGSLTYLFLPSIAKLLVMLETIDVNYCEKIEEILAKAGEEEEEKDVLFHKVNSIVLHNLPNLKFFCNEANALEWPSLKEIRVFGCPSLSTFIPSKLITPKLEEVYNGSFGGVEMCHWMGDLNAAIEHIFKGKEKEVNHETQQEEQIETIEKDM